MKFSRKMKITMGLQLACFKGFSWGQNNFLFWNPRAFLCWRSCSHIKTIPTQPLIDTFYMADTKGLQLSSVWQSAPMLAFSQGGCSLGFYWFLFYNQKPAGTLLAPAVRFQLSERLQDADLKPWQVLKVYKLLDFSNRVFIGSFWEIWWTQVQRRVWCRLGDGSAAESAAATLVLCTCGLLSYIHCFCCHSYMMFSSWFDSHIFAFAYLPP